jgi:hypothetical protein
MLSYTSRGERKLLAAFVVTSVVNVDDLKEIKQAISK